MRRSAIIGLIFLLLGAAGASSQAQKSRVDELKEKIARSNDKDRAHLKAELVCELVTVASDQYSEGDAAKGEQTVKDLTGYVEQASEDAHKNHKKIKQTEIELRKAERRLEDLKRSLDFDNQAPVQKAIDKIEDVRAEILKIMFE